MSGFSIIWNNEKQLVLHKIIHDPPTGQHVEKGPTPASCGEKRDCPLQAFPHVPLAVVHVVSEFERFRDFLTTLEHEICGCQCCGDLQNL